MDPENRDVDYRQGHPALAAGSITVHHVPRGARSAPNRFGSRSALLCFSPGRRAWPILGFPRGIEKFND